MAKIRDQIDIEKPVEQVFRALTNLDNLAVLFLDVSDVQTPKKTVSSVGQKFSATKTIHGKSQRQEFVVSEFDPPKVYEIETTLFKMPVVYSYGLEELSAGLTRVTLVKSGRLRGWERVFSPLLRHLFSKPEHDQDHLKNLAGCFADETFSV